MVVWWRAKDPGLRETRKNHFCPFLAWGHNNLFLWWMIWIWGLPITLVNFSITFFFLHTSPTIPQIIYFCFIYLNLSKFSSLQFNGCLPFSDHLYQDVVVVNSLSLHKNVLFFTHTSAPSTHKHFLSIQKWRLSGYYEHTWENWPLEASFQFLLLSMVAPALGPLISGIFFSLSTEIMPTHPSEFGSNVVITIVEKMTMLIFLYLFQVLAPLFQFSKVSA